LIGDADRLHAGAEENDADDESHERRAGGENADQQTAHHASDTRPRCEV
jgi:hypothetical protein